MKATTALIRERMETFIREILLRLISGRKEEYGKPEVINNIRKEKPEMIKPVSRKNFAGTADILLEVEMFLNREYLFRFNELTETTEFRKRNVTDKPFRLIGQREMNSLCIAARKHGIDCWDRDVARYVYSEDIPVYHPFHTYMEELPAWDGNNRVGQLAHRISSLPIWVDGFHRWMLGLTAQWLGMPQLHGNSVAPVLISTQQGKHKSTFCRLLVPDVLRGYYTDSFDITSAAKAEQKMSAFGLINLDELDKFSPRKMALLKNLMQMAEVNVCKAYRKNYSSLPRLASFIATSNRKDLLTDPTGSRRFLCVEVKDKIEDLTIEHAQVYAQLKNELSQGTRYWFTSEEEAKIMRNNAPFQRRSMAEEIFFTCYRIPNETDNAQLLSAAIMFSELKKRFPAAMRDASEASFRRDLTALGIERVHTCQGNLYRVVRVMRNNP